MKKYIGILLFFLFVSFMGIPSLAQTTDTYSTKTISPSESNIEAEIKGIKSDGGIEKVTIDQAENWAQRKGFEVVHLLQKVVQPFAIIIFILSAFMSLVGAFGNSHLVGRGMWGMFIAIIMYAVVIYAPEIMDYTLGWLSS